MPNQGTQNYRIVIAQAEHGASGEHPVTTEVRGTPAHAEHAHSENPLAHYSSFYFSGVAVLSVLIILAIAFITTRALSKRRPDKRQSLAEQAVESITHFTVRAIGPGSERYVPLVATVFSFVLVSNLIGVLPSVFGVTARDPVTGEPTAVAHLLPAPTANLSMTIALALVVFVMIQVAGIRANGVGNYLKHFAGPIPALAPLMFPLEIIGALAKPLSLSIRLFGNIFGEETVIAVLVALAATTLPVFLPIPFQFPMLMFGVFTALVQAGVFTILTCAYLSLAIGEHAGHHEGHEETVDEFGAPVPAH